MLDIRCPERLHEAIDHAIKVGALASLFTNLLHLHDYANRPGCTRERVGTRCILLQDFAPHSFHFNMQQGDGKGGWADWFHGGLIYSGPDSRGDGSFPALTVDNSGIEGPHWGIHT